MNKKTIKIVSIILTITAIIIAAMVILLYFLRGNTTTITNEVEPFSNDSLSCTSAQITYPFFKNNNAEAQTTRIDLIFANNKLSTIALSYILYYDNKNTVIASEAINHANMNHSFYDNHLGSDAFNAKYTKMSDSLRFNLYAHDSDINPASAKYFLINLTNVQTMPTTLTDYQIMYEEQGMTCVKPE